jgi:hypothetical protein
MEQASNLFSTKLTPICCISGNWCSVKNLYGPSFNQVLTSSTLSWVTTYAFPTTFSHSMCRGSAKNCAKIQDQVHTNTFYGIPSSVGSRIMLGCISRAFSWSLPVYISSGRLSTLKVEVAFPLTSKSMLMI